MLPIPTLVVTSPILSGPLSITNTSVELFPKNGNLNCDCSGVVDTSNLFAPFRLFKISLWPVSNGWFGIRIVLVGMETVFFNPPINVSTSIAPPTVVPTPTDCAGLK